MRKPLLLKSLKMILEKLKQFRQSAYTLLGKGKDAIFELMDAVLTSPGVKSFVELSLSPVFRRGWSSLYAGLRNSRPQRQKLMKLYIKQMPSESRPLLAGIIPLGLARMLSPLKTERLNISQHR